MTIDGYLVRGFDSLTGRLFLAAAVLMSGGCGGRTALLSSTGRADSSAGGSNGPPAGTDGGDYRDVRAADVANTPDGVERGPDASIQDRPNVGADGGADSRPDMARDGDAGTMEAGRADGGSLDLRADGSLSDGVDGGVDARTDSGPDAPTDGSLDARTDSRPDAPTDGSLDARIDGDLVDLGHPQNASDGGPPGLRLLAGVLGGPGAQDGKGAAALFYFPSGVASDGAGNLYVADSANNTIRKIVVATGATTTLAGSVGVAGSADGTGVAAQFYSPQGLASDGAGNLFVVDSVNNTIRKVAIAGGVVTTFAGSAVVAGSDDGIGAAARFRYPQGVASDGAGNLFVADSANHTIRRIVIATGKVTTLAGLAGVAGGDDGTGATARFDFPQGATSDGAGNLFVADSGNHTIRKIVIATGEVTTLAGTAGTAGSDDGTGAKARFNFPQGVTSDGAGNLLVADSGNTIRKVVIATGAVTTLAGSAVLMGSDDGTGSGARFDYPEDVASDGAGNLFVADTNNHAIRKVVIATGAVTTLAGSASSAGHNDGPAIAARFQSPTGVASDGAGNLFVADFSNHTIREIVLATQTVSTLAGLAGMAGSDDGAGAGARFANPSGVASDGAGNLFVADSGNQTIRKVVVATGVVTTLAGDPATWGSVDGTGSAAQFDTPVAVVSDGAGNLFVADSGNHTIRKVVISGGTVTTLAGSAGIAGSDDGTGATARFDNPTGLAVDGAGNLFVADAGNRTIRKLVIATAAVSTLAGSVGTAGGDDGIGAAALFDTPGALVTDNAGNLFVADSGKDTIRKVHVATRLVSTVVGTPGRWENILGPLPADIASPGGLAFLPTGELVLTDWTGNVVFAAQF